MSKALNDLHKKRKTYLDALSSKQDKHGFVDHGHCDSLLFSGLLGCVPDVDVNVEAAFDRDSGMWHRRPLEKPCFDCFTGEDLGSKSSISRDMLLGLAWFAYYNKRLDISEQIIKHAMRNWGFMGEAVDAKTKWSRCQIMPSLFSTFCWISYKLGGPSRWWARWIPADVGSSTAGFQAHLQVLHVMLRKKLTDDNPYWWEENSLQRQFQRVPTNPLFAAAAGRKDVAIRILGNEKYWPSDRLPTAKDRGTNWLPMRDPKDWEPKDSDEEYSGADFLWLYWLVFG